MFEPLTQVFASQLLPHQLSSPEQDNQHVRKWFEGISVPHAAGSHLMRCMIMRCLSVCPDDFGNADQLQHLLEIISGAEPQHATRQAANMPTDALLFYCIRKAQDLASPGPGEFHLDSLDLSDICAKVEAMQSGWNRLRQQIFQEQLGRLVLQRLLEHVACMLTMDRILASSGPLIDDALLHNQIAAAVEAEKHLTVVKPVVQAVSVWGVESSILSPMFEQPIATFAVATLRDAQQAAKQWLQPLQPELTFLCYFLPELKPQEGGRSILFNHYLDKELRRRKGSDATISTATFAAVLECVRSILETMLKGEEANFNELKEAGKKLNKESADGELKVVAGFFCRNDRELQERVDKTLH
eukprot:2938903-Prymnesium_polylepis.1